MAALQPTLSLICRLLAVALLQQSAEMLALRHSWSSDGIWSWGILQKELPRSPALHQSLSFFFGAAGFQILQWLQMACGLILLIHPFWMVLTPYMVGLCFVVTLLTAVRWRGTFNGGSDCMTLVVLFSLSIAAIVPLSPFVSRACLWWISVQVCLSFFISGAIKLRKRNWRSGAALAGFLRVSNYGVPRSAIKISAHPLLCRGLSWVVILFECLFPLALIDHRLAVSFCVGGLVFQFANFYFFGLNRFLFAWLAAYPALLFCSL